MRILAVADVHSPRYFPEFKESIMTCPTPDLFLFAGDMIDRGKAEEFVQLVDLINNVLGKNFPIVACFGNEEYTEVRSKIHSLVANRITILDERAELFTLSEKKVGIVGTQGSLDRPTTWQKRNIVGIKRIFERRAQRAEYLLKRLRADADYRILLMHYSPCLETCEGEDFRSFPWLVSRKFYSVVKRERPDLVIHGHVHNAINLEARIGETLVRNVAFPAVKSVTVLEI